MIYRNVITGAEIKANSEILAPNWELVSEVVAPKVEHSEEPEKETPKKSAPKKRGTRK